MEETARQCVRAAGGVPLIVDGDTGFGGASNLRRTIRGFAEAGAAAACTLWFAVTVAALAWA